MEDHMEVEKTMMVLSVVLIGLALWMTLVWG
jgi:hypothetical protein